MRFYLDNHRSVEAPGATLGEVLRSCAEQYPAMESVLFDFRDQLHAFINVYVDGEDARYLQGVDTPTRPDSEVEFVPAGGGG